MRNKVFIQSNNKQFLGAVLARFALKKNSTSPDLFDVEILNVDELDVFKNFQGKKYLRDNREITYNPNDLQSFTLSRFMPPELAGYRGRVIVIDPDIFSIADINELFNFDLKNHALAVCRKKNGWDSSVMLLDCDKLRHWRMADFLNKLEKKEVDYTTVMSLANETSITELPRVWNSIDCLNENTKMLHTSHRLTQPWKTGLRVDFTRNPHTKIFGLIPKEWVLRLMGRYPMTYQPHPDKNIERFFFRLVNDALREDAITKEFLNEQITAKNVRQDFWKCLSQYQNGK